MRTKSLLGLALLAAGLSTAGAQVYSANVVGYVNVPLTANKLAFISYPFQDPNGNYDITNTVPAGDVQAGANIFQWTGTQWNPNVPTWYSGFGWYPDTVISNGVGFFLLAQATSTLTFVGQVPQGTLNQTIPTGLSTLANQVPVSTNFPGSAFGNAGDNMFTWNNAGQFWDTAVWTYYGGYGWDNGGGAGDSANGPLLNPASAVFYVNGGAAIPFTQNFTVQ
jgi:hypothetical protein